MPVTARQKILEETNRTLRRQLAEYEEAGQSLAGRTVEDLKAQSVSQTRCSELEKVNRELSLQTVNLVSISMTLPCPWCRPLDLRWDTKYC